MIFNSSNEGRIDMPLPLLIGGRLKSILFFSLRNKFTPTVISIFAGIIFNHYRQQDKAEYLTSIQNMKDTLSAKIELSDARTKEQIEREKAKIAVYENACALFEKKTGIPCIQGSKEGRE